MYDDIILQRTIPVGRRVIPQKQMHLPVDPIRQSREERIVCPGRCLHRHNNMVVALPGLIEIALLEVERGFGEAVLVRDVMHLVDKVECVDEGRSEIVRVHRWLRGVLIVDERQPRTGLADNVSLHALVCQSIVSSTRHEYLYTP